MILVMKEKFRKELLEKRKKIPKNKVLSKSKKIKQLLFDTEEFKNASTILFYISYGNEVFTHEMVKECISNKRKITVPVTDVENKTLILSKLKNWEDLTLGAYDILEPKEDKIEEVSIYDIDLIIVPGIGYDELGCRMGHGVGYYDDLLKNATNSHHFGLAFESQIVENIPIEPHDIPVHKIITEKRIIDCLAQPIF